MQVYLREIRKLPRLSEEPETELSRHVLADDEEAETAARSLVEANLEMVVSIAERYPRGNMHLLDLVKTGNYGLLAALTKDICGSSGA